MTTKGTDLKKETLCYKGQFKWKRETCKKGGKHEIDRLTNGCKKCQEHLQHSFACILGKQCVCDLTKPLYDI
jgi:hypothetical protein